jgi:hypothetical protein
MWAWKPLLFAQTVLSRIWKVVPLVLDVRQGDKERLYALLKV